MSPADLLASCRRLGVELFAAPEGLRVRAPAGVMTDALRECLRREKPGILSALVSACPSGCGRPADEKRRCWRCENRACERCGRPTGSAFIATCTTCDLAT